MKLKLPLVELRGRKSIQWTFILKMEESGVFITNMKLRQVKHKEIKLCVPKKILQRGIHFLTKDEAGQISFHTFLDHFTSFIWSLLLYKGLFSDEISN